MFDTLLSTLFAEVTRFLWEFFEARSFRQIARLDQPLSVRIILLAIRALIVLVKAIPLITIVLVSIAIVGWPLLLTGLWAHIRSAMGSPWLRAIAVAALLLLGGLLYLARRRARSLYGIVEIWIGGAACWAGLGHTDVSGFAGGVTLAGGVYVIVRGLDNFVDGYNADKTKVVESFRAMTLSVKEAVVGGSQQPGTSMVRTIIELVVSMNEDTRRAPGADEISQFVDAAKNDNPQGEEPPVPPKPSE
jgi:hypothetical protein